MCRRSRDSARIKFSHVCDAIHPQCAGEWLCCPCKAYEDERAAAGVPQSQIRPPRWATVGDGGSPAGTLKLEGGSRSVPCALCPISLGAFKQSNDGPWVHLVSWGSTIRVRSRVWG